MSPIGPKVPPHAVYTLPDCRPGGFAGMKQPHRKILLSTVIASIALSGLGPVLSAPHAFATAQAPGQPVATPQLPANLNASTLATSMVQQLAAGQSPTAIANAIQGLGVPPQLVQGLQGTLGALAGNTNLNANSAAALLAGQMMGSVTPQIASALGSIPGFGNLSGTGILNALQTPNISNLLSGMTAQGAAGFLNQLIGAGANPAGLAQLASQAGLGALTNLLGNLSPSLTNLFGAGLGGALGTFLSGMQGAFASNPLTGALSALTGTNPGALGNLAAAQPAAAAGGGCCTAHQTAIPEHYGTVRVTVTREFAQLRTWMITVYWIEHILPALMLMAEQLTVAGMAQVEIIGEFLDAKHQLETQRLFQQLQARAHKDYHPSEGMCTFGTNVRSLVASERRSNVAQLAIAQRVLQRSALSGAVVSQEADVSDMRSRLEKFILNYCDRADNANGLTRLCQPPTPVAARRNIDVDYTKNIESRLTLDIDVTAPAAEQGTPDEEDVFALAANLYSHNVPPRISPSMFGNGQGQIRLSAVEKYMDLRAVLAKRSVAQNSFAAITAMRANGDPGSAPYTRAIVRELGLTDPEQIVQLIGENPSYFAQMELLTKKLYQNPVFYTELYDKPANVDRKGAALQAIGLMQDRDLFNSLIRSEAVLSVLLETMLMKEQEKVANAARKINQSGGVR